jgi:hypothetical protein
MAKIVQKHRLCDRNDSDELIILQTRYVINPAIKVTSDVMPDLIRHPVYAWIPAFAGVILNFQIK